MNFSRFSEWITAPARTWSSRAASEEESTNHFEEAAILFKDIAFNRKTVGLLLLAAGCAIAVVVNGVDKAFIFLLLITAYIVLGLTETIIFMKRSLVVLSENSP